jgi:hypothetical protein
MGFWPSIIVGPLVLLILGFIVYSLYKRVATKFPKKPVNQAFALGCCVLAALFIDERVFRLFWVPSGCEGVYTLNFAVKWEIAALLATGIITVQYWSAELRMMGKIQSDLHRRAITAILFAILSLVFAVYALLQMLSASTREQFLTSFAWHFLCLFIMSCCFLRADYLICKGVIVDKDPNNDLKNVSHLSVYLVDLPVSVSLLLLGLFCGVHLAEHSWFHFLHPFLHDAPKPVERINLWTAEEYFMSGAIAFQYLLSTTIYLILALGLVQIRNAPAGTKGQETRIELPL